MAGCPLGTLSSALGADRLDREFLFKEDNFCSLLSMVRVWTQNAATSAFDIETAKVPEDQAEWNSHRPLGISCAATLLAGAKNHPLARRRPPESPQTE